MMDRDCHTSNYSYFSLQTLAIYLFSALMLLLTIFSLYQGVSALDESFYISLALRFSLGDRLFIDETNIVQAFALFCTPFIKLFLAFNKTTEGIIIFCRQLHWFATFFTACIVYFSVKNILQPLGALLLALACIIYVPVNLHSLSYNTLSMLFLTISLFLGFFVLRRVTETNNHSSTLDILLIFACGLCNAFTIISYPTLIFLPIVSFLCFLGYLPKKKKIVWYLLGFVAGLSWFIFVISQVGLDQLLSIYHYVNNLQVTHGFSGFMRIVHKHDWVFKYVISICCIFLSLLLFLIKKQKLSLADVSLSAFIILAITTVYYDKAGGQAIFLIVLGLTAPFLFFVSPTKKVFKELLIMVWLPSFMTGIAMGWSSSNGINNSAIGLFPGALVSVLMMIEAQYKATPLLSMRTSLSSRALLVLLLFTCTLQYFNLRFTYSDLPIPYLTYQIKSGPLKGIKTSKENHQYYTQLHQDLQSVFQQQYRILFFDNFPIGYLFSTMRPATSTTWLFSKIAYPQMNRQYTVDYFKKNQIQPDIIVRIHYVPLLGEAYHFYYDKTDPINRLINHDYKLRIKHQGYDIYQRVASH